MLLELNGGSNTIECVGIRYTEQISLTFGILSLIHVAIAVDCPQIPHVLQADIPEDHICTNWSFNCIVYL